MSDVKDDQWDKESIVRALADHPEPFKFVSTELPRFIHVPECQCPACIDKRHRAALDKK